MFSESTPLNISTASTAARHASRETLIARLSDHGVDTSRLVAAFRSDDSRAILKTLGELAEESYPGLSSEISGVLRSIINTGTNGILRDIAMQHWSAAGVDVAPDAPICAGGMSWIVKVTFAGNDCALALPKYTCDDYEQRIAVRAALSDLVPHELGFEVPRVLKVFDMPAPACLMALISGENCYTRTFDRDGKPYASAPGRLSGIEVFKKLGEMAAAFTSIRRSEFGSLSEPPVKSASDYLQRFLAPIEADLMGDPTVDFSRYGYSRQQLEKIIEWVRRDAELQTKSCLQHGDLSPWNLLHNQANDLWTIADGDDARFAIEGEQIGVCLNSMRGNYNPEWINAIADGYGVVDEQARRNLLLRGAAYGAVTYGLYNATKPLSGDTARWRNMELSFMAPCVRLFDELQ